MYTAALVGCGKIGSTFADDPLMRGDVFSHAEAYHLCPDTEFLAIADTDAAALAKCGERWGVEKRYSSVADLMQEAQPQIVSVATPTPSHYAIVTQLLAAGHLPMAILCEKPVASTIYEAERLVALASDKGVLLVVMHMRRYANNMRNLREFLHAGGIGELRGISGWLTKGTLHNGTHWFDLLRYFAGEVELVSGLDNLNEGGADPTLDVAMKLESGMMATMRAAEHANFTICEMDIMGSRGRAQIVDSSYRVEISTAVPSPRYSGYVELVPSAVNLGDRKNVMLHAIEDVVHCLDTGDTPQSTGEDGLAALRIAIAAKESARNHGAMRYVRDAGRSDS